jgi:hypothetical protein
MKLSFRSTSHLWYRYCTYITTLNGSWMRYLQINHTSNSGNKSKTWKERIKSWHTKVKFSQTCIDDLTGVRVHINIHICVTVILLLVDRSSSLQAPGGQKVKMKYIEDKHRCVLGQNSAYNKSKQLKLVGFRIASLNK